jgi:catechol 2,3-dioxygenase-like lactoylglutathione lyase family enzyme
MFVKTKERSDQMLTKGRVHPTIAVTDLERAKDFYGGKLGLNANGDIAEGHVSYEVGDGTYLVVFERPDPPKAENTVASFTVDDAEETIKWLKERGVVFEEYDSPGLKTVDGVATLGNFKGGWFKDPDGNILAVTSEVS